MQPAPMTPDTLKLIRANAERMPAQQLAEQLGWTVERLQRAARDRNIHLCAAALSIVEQKPIPPGVLAPVLALLTPMQAAIVDVLAEAEPDEFLSAPQILAALDDASLSPESVRAMIERIRPRLNGTGYDIDGRQRRGGGYRLSRPSGAARLPKEADPRSRNGAIVVAAGMSVAEVAGLLSERQGHLLLIIADVDADGITTLDLAHRMGIRCSRENICKTIRAINDKLSDSGWRIIVAGGPNRYRLRRGA